MNDSGPVSERYLEAVLARCRVLDESQARQFLLHGYLHLPSCFDAEFARPLVEAACARLGYDPEKPATWEQELAYPDHDRRFLIAEISPRCWGAICDLLGGEDRIAPKPFSIGRSNHFSSVDSTHWSDAFIINFRYGADQPWQPPSATVAGWHKDGGYFRHFLDSPEQALVTIIYWSDVGPRAGGTFVAPDSVGHIARGLARHPEGLEPKEDLGELVADALRRSSRFCELTGGTGDVFLVHPFMLHASSYNHSGRPRFMTNPPVALRQPMCFARDDPADYSLLELSVLDALSSERLDFQPTRQRRLFSPITNETIGLSPCASGSPRVGHSGYRFVKEERFA